MNGIDANSDAVSEKLETAPNKFTAARYLHADLVKCRPYNAAIYPIWNLYVAKRYVAGET
jgi:hypothetical protein